MTFPLEASALWDTEADIQAACAESVRERRRTLFQITNQEMRVKMDRIISVRTENISTENTMLKEAINYDRNYR